MSHELHDVLQRASELAGPASFDPDALWKQATRKKRRNGALAALSVVLLVTMGSLGIWWGRGVVDDSYVPSPAGQVSSSAMPSRVYGVPANVQAESSRLDVGVVAVATMTQGGEPVVVSAVDGRYHVLQLPGFDRSPLADTPLSVSRDGTKLAYGWHGLLPETSGVRVLDTVSGHLSTYRVPGGVGAQCGNLSWSMSGDWLAFSCLIDRSLDVHGSSGNVHVERLGVLTGDLAEVPAILGDGSGYLAMADDGSVAMAGGGDVVLWRPAAARGQRVIRTGVQGPPDSASWLDAPRQLIVASGLSSTLRVMDPTAGRGGLGPAVALSGPGTLVGTVRTGQVAVLISRGSRQELATYVPGSPPVVRVSIDEVSPADAYSFATDLLREPSRDMGKPDWPTDWAARAWTAGWVLLLVAGAVVVLLVVRRRRRYGGSQPL